MSEEAAGFNPLALLLLAISAWMTWSLPRRFAVCPLLAMICLVPLGQQIVVGGLHFFLFRVLLLVGILRVIQKGELRQVRICFVDKTLLWWAAATILIGTLPDPSFDLFRNRLGEAYNALGCFFFVRSVVIDSEDVLIAIRAFAFASIPLAAAMLVEKATGHNPFYVFGGVGEFSEIRGGHLRAQGAFRHPILAGTFGATEIPLFAGLWVMNQRSWALAAIGICAAMIISFAASSSGALMALGVGAMGVPLWLLRRHLRLLRRGVLLAVLVLVFTMNAPIWYLFDRLSGITGGTGWYRSYLIGQAVQHLNEWWLCGTTYTAHWVPWGDLPLPSEPNMADITNHYIMEGVKGGMIRLLLFTLLIVKSFKLIGYKLRVNGCEASKTFLPWVLGVSLFGHCVSFLSVHYFDQTILIWYWILASISAVAVGNKFDGQRLKEVMADEQPTSFVEQSAPQEAA